MPVNFKGPSPKTLDEAIRQLASGLSTEEAAHINAKGAEMFHHTVGMSMRNAWGLWEPTSLLAIHFREAYGLGHADDMSGLILAGLTHRVRGLPYDPAADVESYKLHWRALWIDPLTQEKI